MDENRADKAPTGARGTVAYDNWKAAIAGLPSSGAEEFPLFTDAPHVTGSLLDGHGPYQLLNLTPLPFSGALHPALLLRVEWHMEEDPASPDWHKTDTETYHGGGLSDEIAALVSLSIGIRLRAGGATREFAPDGDPRGVPHACNLDGNPALLKPARAVPVLPGALGTHCLHDALLVKHFCDLEPEDAVAVVRAARLYQDAVWIAESQPELSWLLLVSAVEAAAGHWRGQTETPLERLRASKPELEPVLKAAGGCAHVLEVAKLIAPYVGSTRKFVDFILHFLPDPLSERPQQYAQIPWDPKSMDEAMRTIYDWRSRALHCGVAFPLPMCRPPVRREGALSEKPIASAVAAQDAVWVAEDTPMLLHAFEHIVRGALLRWWGSMLGK